MLANQPLQSTTAARHLSQYSLLVLANIHVLALRGAPLLACQLYCLVPANPVSAVHGDLLDLVAAAVPGAYLSSWLPAAPVLGSFLDVQSCQAH